jgi:hypothetical protein
LIGSLVSASLKLATSGALFNSVSIAFSAEIEFEVSVASGVSVFSIVGSDMIGFEFSAAFYEVISIVLSVST